jgi:hypothetical protein
MPGWEILLADAATLQTKIPGAVLVGGTAAALHAAHRFSFDHHDHVAADLRDRYEEAMTALESIAGWRTTRRVRGKMILGEVHSIPAGLRQLRRSAPLETTEIQLPGGDHLRVPTVAEMLRIKAFLAVDRNATRDYPDVAALSNHLGAAASALALAPMNDLYAEFAGEGGDMLTSVVVRLADPAPYDLTDLDLAEYKGIVQPWDDWDAVVRQCRAVAAAVVEGPR